MNGNKGENIKKLGQCFDVRQLMATLMTFALPGGLVKVAPTSHTREYFSLIKSPAIISLLNSRTTYLMKTMMPTLAMSCSRSFQVSRMMAFCASVSGTIGWTGSDSKWGSADIKGALCCCCCC